MKNYIKIVISTVRRQIKHLYMLKKQNAYNKAVSDKKDEIDYYSEEYMKTHSIYIFSSIKEILNRTDYY